MSEIINYQLSIINYQLIINALSLFFGANFGLIIADIDHNLPFVKHRSAITHGPLLALWLYSQPELEAGMLWFFVGFLPAYAVHQVFDMWPKQWVGIAKIHLFGEYRLPGILSFAWLMAGAIGAVIIATGMAGPVVVSALLLVMFGYKANHGEETLIAPAIIMVVVAMLGIGYSGLVPILINLMEGT